MKKYLFLSLALCTTLLANATITGPDEQTGAVTSTEATCGTTVYATEKPGYHFVKWIKTSELNSEEAAELSTAPNWTIESFDGLADSEGNYDFTAIFEANKTKITIKYVFDDGTPAGLPITEGEYGEYFTNSENPCTLTGQLGNDQFETGEKVTITINGLTGCYVVKEWQSAGAAAVAEETGDLSYSYTIQEADAADNTTQNEVILTLVLKKKTFSITIRPDSITKGSVSFTAPVSDPQE